LNKKLVKRLFLHHIRNKKIRRKSKKMLGTVKWYNVSKRFGFLESETQEDYFIHYANLSLMNPLRLLKAEDRVSFEPSKNEKGLIALNILVL
jgi:cold shock protein